MRKHQPLNRNRIPQVQRQHHNQQHLTCLLIRRTQHRVQIPQQERRRHSETDADKHPIEKCELGPGDYSDQEPGEVGVSV